MFTRKIISGLYSVRRVRLPMIWASQTRSSLKGVLFELQRFASTNNNSTNSSRKHNNSFLTLPANYVNKKFRFDPDTLSTNEMCDLIKSPSISKSDVVIRSSFH